MINKKENLTKKNVKELKKELKIENNYKKCTTDKICYCQECLALMLYQ